MIKPLFKNKFGWVKPFMIGLFLGASIVALTLDNRYSAMIKAFQNPQAINEVSVATETVVTQK